MRICMEKLPCLVETDHSGGKPRPERRKPANADDLDKELDGFMDKSGDVNMA